MGADDGHTTFSFIDEGYDIPSIIEEIDEQPTSPPSIYIDLEGAKLPGLGTISILQIHVAPEEHTYLIDVHKLGQETFSETGCDNNSLKDIFESPDIPKVFFDVRNAADALSTNFGIHLAGVQDIQLMALAPNFRGQVPFELSISNSVARDAPISREEKSAWIGVMERAKEMYYPPCGGSYEVFYERPLSITIQKYCHEKVRLLPGLWEHYRDRMNTSGQVKGLLEMATREAVERVREFESTTYRGQLYGMDMRNSGSIQLINSPLWKDSLAYIDQSPQRRDP